MPLTAAACHAAAAPALPRLNTCAPLSCVQAALWVFCSVGSEGSGGQLGKELSGCFLAFVSAAAAFAFLLYGGRLWLMLRRFPIESRGRRKKLREVGLVTTICATCFLFRCGACGGGAVRRQEPQHAAGWWGRGVHTHTQGCMPPPFPTHRPTSPPTPTQERDCGVVHV